jgi:hypothetical protein
MAGRALRYIGGPPLFISGYPEPALRDAEAQVLADVFLAKPITQQQLIGSVGRLLPL